MPVSVNHALKLGLVSAKAAAKFKPSILNQTRAQPSKMAKFDSKQKHEGKAHDPGVHDVDVINSKATQADRAGSMPSKGGAVNASRVPGPKMIDQYYQKPKFPAGGNVSGSGSAKVGVRGKRPVTTGGKGGGNAGNKHYYGGPKGRDGT
jgi:hypothetical protein